MLERLNRTSTIASFIAGGLILFIFSVYVHISTAYLTPGVVFRRMLDRSLQTTSFTRTSTQIYGATSVINISEVAYAPEPFMKGNVEVRQGVNSIKTELFGTKEKNYVRYAAIAPDNATEEQRQQVEAVVGKWAVQPTEGSTSFLQESVYNLIPIANLPANGRQEFIQELLDKGIYKIEANSIVREREGIRWIYTFNIKVEVGAYASLYQKYAERYGLGKLAILEGAEGVDAQSIIALKVDAFSARLMEIDIKDADKTEVYSLDNAHRSLHRPEATLSVEDLQEKLQSL